MSPVLPPLPPPYSSLIKATASSPSKDVELWLEEESAPPLPVLPPPPLHPFTLPVKYRRAVLGGDERWMEVNGNDASPPPYCSRVGRGLQGGETVHVQEWPPAPSPPSPPSLLPLHPTLSRLRPLHGGAVERAASFRAAMQNGQRREEREERRNGYASPPTVRDVRVGAGCQPSSVHSSLPSPTSTSSSLSSTMRRERPKSYILATSSSFPVTQRLHDSTHPPQGGEMTSSEGSSTDHPTTAAHRGGETKEPSRAPAHLHPSTSHHEGVTSFSSARLNRLFALFSHAPNTSAPPHASTKESKRERAPKRSRTTVVSERARVETEERRIHPGDVVLQGAVQHVQMSLGGERGGREEWRQAWAILSLSRLFLADQMSSTRDEQTGEKVLCVPSDALLVHLEGALADIAYEYAKMQQHRHVVRVVTQQRSEHLIQFASEETQVEWVKALQAAAHSGWGESEGALQEAATERLIMHRYKAKSSAIGSPLNSKRSSQHDTNESNGESSSGTPKSARTWVKKTTKDKDRKGKQSASSSSHSDGATATTSYALGNRLADCPNGGEGDVVPAVMRACVSVVVQNGMDTVGIYRIPGNTAAVNALKEILLNGGAHAVDTSDSRWKDVNVVSSLLKMFLRKLPEPLLTDKLYPFFIDANRMGNHHHRLHKMRNLLRKLPRVHYETLKFLIGHLLDVSKNAHVNKMETRNLALMFGPSIVRPSDDTMATMVTHMSDQCRIVETFLNYYEWLFDGEGTSEDAVPTIHPADLEPRDSIRGGVGGESGPPGVSAATFNDMHSLIIRANEKEAADLMKENDKGKIKSMLNVRRSSKRDKTKGAKGGPLHAPPSVASPAPPLSQVARRTFQSTPTQSSVESAFCGHYQERDIDAAIASRAPREEESVSSGGGTVEDCEEPCTSRSEGALTSDSSAPSHSHPSFLHKMNSARRIFIAGSEAAAMNSLSSPTPPAAIQSLATHTQHLHQAASPALEVYSAETREKIKRLQLLGTSGWRSEKVTSWPSREDGLSCTSDYSTTSSAPPSHGLLVTVGLDAAAVSDYASCDPSPSAPFNHQRHPLPHAGEKVEVEDGAVAEGVGWMRRKKLGKSDSRRHTLAEVNLPPQNEEADRGTSSFSKFSRWFRSGLSKGKSMPDVAEPSTSLSSTDRAVSPPVIVTTSPHDLSPSSDDVLL